MPAAVIGPRAALLALFFATSAAQGAPPAKALACQACHGADGLSASADIPNLAGQKKAYLAGQLRAFREGSRKNELMSAIASQLVDDDIEALSAHWSSLPAAGMASPGQAAEASPARLSHIVFPTDFPQGFSEYRREDDAESKTVSRSFANAVALQAAREGRPLPDGSAIVVANHAARVGADGRPVVGADGRFIADKALSYSAMEARSGWGDEIPALLRNGNWNYALFKADGTPRIADLQPRCLACHKPQAQNSYVFTFDALKAKAHGG